VTLLATPFPGLAFALALASSFDVRSAAADASLFLLVGGLVMLTLICILVLVQNVLPERGGPQPTNDQRAAMRRLRSLDGGPLAQHIAQRKGRRRLYCLAPVDLALDRVVELRLGEPRLLQALDRASRIRLYGCRGCSFAAASAAAPGAQAPGCARERAALEEVFGAVFGSSVRAQESACRRRGDAACEFEVAH
jgi:hypothetical protein